VESELRRIRFLEFGKRRELQCQWTFWYNASNRAWCSLCQARADWEAADIHTNLPARQLMEDKLFRSQVEELARNIVLVAGVAGEAGKRQILEFNYEASFTFSHSGSWSARLLQYFGWKPWQLNVLIGGRGGSQHLEVVTPEGAEIVRIDAEPIFTDISAKPVSVPGSTPHVSIPLPEGGNVRYRAAIFVRVSRSGWLTASWLVAAVIVVSLIAGRIDIGVLFASSPSGASTASLEAGPAATLEAGTAATVLLALLGVFATLLVSVRQHPFVSKLLQPLRILSLVDFAVVLVAVGSLVLHSNTAPVPRTCWSVLVAVAVAVLVVVTVSWWRPGRDAPHGR
jgi:hypothetical protein